MHVPAITEEGSDEVRVDLPLYQSRRRLTARDPRAVVAAYMYGVKFKLPWLLGLRSCPYCPDCNLEDETSDLFPPCQDIFGASTLLMGGVARMAATMGGATEFQNVGTPRWHGFVHIVNIYQHRTLADVKEAIEKAWLDPTTVLRFSQWMHLKEPANEAQYEGDKDIVALAWRRRHDDGSHEGMRCPPRCL